MVAHLIGHSLLCNRIIYIGTEVTMLPGWQVCPYPSSASDGLSIASCLWSPIVKKQYSAPCIYLISSLVSYLLPLAFCLLHLVALSASRGLSRCSSNCNSPLPTSAHPNLETCAKYSSWKLCKILTLNLWNMSCAKCSPWKLYKISEKSWLKFVLKSEPSFKVLVVEAGWCEGRGGVGSDTNVRFWLSARS